MLQKVISVIEINCFDV